MSGIPPILPTTYSPHSRFRGLRIYATIVVTALAFLTVCGSAAAECINYGDFLHWVGSEDTPGGSGGVAVFGSHAYVVGVYGLIIMDITMADSPVTVGNVDFLGGDDVAVSGNYAYVASDVFGLRVIDVTNPANPVLVSTVDTPNIATAVAIQGDYAYVGDDFAGLQVIDISNPPFSFIAGSVDTPGMALDVAVMGIYAYVADNNSGVQVVDIADPTNPVIVANLATPGGPRGVAAAGMYIYIADNASLQIADISDPLNPVIVGSVAAPLNARSVAVLGNYAYVTGGLQTVDITDPTNPVLLGGLRASARDVAVMGNHAYLAAEGSGAGLHVIDVTVPESPDFVGTEDMTYANRLFVVGGYAYIAAYSLGMQVVDVSTPDAPVLVSTVDTPGNARDVSVMGNYAYVADEFMGLQVVDVSDPLNPHIVASLATGEQALGVVIGGTFAYVADGNAGLTIIDISDPLTPTTVGSADTGFGVDVDVLGSYAYVAGYIGGLSDTGLSVVDVADPTSPSVVGSVLTPGYAGGIDVGIDHAYVADGLEGLQIIDISNPNLPVIVGNAGVSYEARQVMIGGIWAYVADNNGLKVIGIMDPLNPSVVGGIDTFPPGLALGVFVDGDYAYLAARGNGLQIAPLQCESVPAALQAYSARWAGRHVEVAWQLIDVAGDLTFDVSRRQDDSDVFARIDGADITKRGREFVFADRSTQPGTLYNYRVGILEDGAPVTAFETTVSTPFAALTLAQNYPNPFNPTTRIAFSIENESPVTLSIHDAAGRLVTTLIARSMLAGDHVTEWNGRDTRGESVASGVYFYRLTAGDRTLTRKAVMLK